MKDSIEEQIKLFSKLKPIFYTKEITVTPDGQKSIKEDYITAAKKFNFVDEFTSEPSQEKADELMIKTKIEIASDLLDRATSILESNNALDDYEAEIENFTLQDDYKDVFKFACDIMTDYCVISPYDTIFYEPIYDEEDSIIGQKLQGDNKEDD